MKHDSNSYGLVMACNRAFKSQKLCKINHNVSDTNIRHSALAWTNTYSSYMHRQESQWVKQPKL